MKEHIINIDFQPNESQFPFFHSNKKFLLANGGYGSGKSTILSMKAILISIHHPGTMGLIGRKTYPELRDTTRRVFFEQLPRPLVKKWNQTENHLVLQNDSEILFRALDDTFKVGSLELGWFGIDELSEFPSEVEFNALRGRLRHPKGPLVGFGATNPATKEHWLYKMFVEEQNPDFECFEMNTYSNKEHLPEGYIKDLEKFPPEWQERYLKGKWGIVPKGTRVFSKFRPSIHIGDFEYNPYKPLYRAWDFGYRHPAVLFAQETDWGRLLILREHQGFEIQLDDFAKRVIKKTNQWFPKHSSTIDDFCDIAGNQRSDKSQYTSIEMLRSLGVDPSYKKTISLEVELMQLNNMFEELRGGLPRIGVDSKGCPILSDGLAGGYYRDPEGLPCGDGYFEHLVDCLRYVVLNVYGVMSRKTISQRFVSRYRTLTQARV